jgi:hypothetical protein
MTVVLSDGPLGLEAVHEWTSGGFGNPTFNLNDLSGSPRVKVTKITGWRSGPEIESLAVNHVGRMGESPLVISPRGKTIVYEFTVKEKDPRTFRQTTTALAEAFQERSSVGTMRMKPKSPYGDPADYWFYQGRVMQIDMDEGLDGILTDPHGFWTISGQLGIHLFDPRFYWNEQTDSGAVASPIAITNDGLVDVDPTIVIVVGTQCDLLNIESTTLAKYIQFVSLPVGTWVIDFKNRNVYDQSDPTISGLPYMVLPSFTDDWWGPQTPGIVPGGNVITAAITGAGALTSIQVTFNPAML